MIPIPLVEPPALVGWRLDAARHAATWNAGVGAGLVGGRWNSPGVEAVYASLDPSTAIIEVAVHKGFRVLDAQPHTLTAFTVDAAAALHVVRPEDVPNPNWLRPGVPTAAQQDFGDALLARHGLFAIASVVSSRAWNLVVRADAADRLTLIRQEPFALDPRLAPPARSGGR